MTPSIHSCPSIVLHHSEVTNWLPIVCINYPQSSFKEIISVQERKLNGQAISHPLNICFEPAHIFKDLDDDF